tara:strand:+ start:328 stop:1182 length:855 start_codon:yes stop_codon:yes gene_type:complete
MSCSPQYNSNKNTCYSLEDLKDIAKNYNKTLEGNNKIKLNQSKQKLYNALVKANYNECGDNEYCWLKQNYMEINKNIDKFLEKFRPEQPNTWKDNPKQWLNTYNLLNVMSQYEKKYKNFKFLGVHPIDFAFKKDNTCISQNMCDLNISDLIKNKIYKLGNIFNLDKHYQSGSHWVSLFANLNPKSKNYGIYYYDSNGRSAPSEVKNFVSKLISDNSKLTNKKINFYQNNIKHQFENSECGIFSLYFMDQCLKNVSFTNFINKKNLNDLSMFKLRNKFFNKKNSS